jgi:indolepyruvate ferredoxin oxidoreductase, alpha subunit
MVSYAFNFSEKYEMPVILRPTTRVCHGKSDITIPETEKPDKKIGFEKRPQQWVMLPAHARVRHKVLMEKQDIMAEALGSSKWNQLDIVKGAELAIIASGVASVYAREAIERLGIKASFLKISTYPVPLNLIEQLLDSVGQLPDQVGQVLVIEELEPVVEEAVRSISGTRNVDVHGKDMVPRNGELNVSIVEAAISKVAGLNHTPHVPEGLSVELPNRPPVMCPGCPHRATYYAMKKAFGKSAVFPGDIGCYTLGVQMGTMDTCLCMGASISTASGIYHQVRPNPSAVPSATPPFCIPAFPGC